MTRDLTEKELEKRAEILKADVEQYGLETVKGYSETAVMLLNAFAVIETAQEQK